MLVASSIAQLAKHLPSAGSIYTYQAEAIHPSIGFLVGWGYSLVEALIGHLATTRTWFAMSRIGVIPAPLARTLPGGSPRTWAWPSSSW